MLKNRRRRRSNPLVSGHDTGAYQSGSSKRERPEQRGICSGRFYLFQNGLKSKGALRASQLT